MNHHTIIFFTGIINKMSQLFSELNYLYLNAMLPIPQHNFEESTEANQNIEEKKEQQMILVNTKENVVSQIQKEQSESKPVIEEQKVKEDIKEFDFAIPKTPLSSFMIFYNEHREEIKKNFPQCNSKQIKSLACNIWKDLSKQEKQVYYKLQKQQTVKYNKDLQIFRQNMQKIPNQKRQLLSQKIRKKKQQKDKKAKAVESEEK